MPGGLVGLTPGAEVEIISSFAASNQELPAVAAEPGWFVLGAFRVAADYANARLEAIGVVSADGLTLRARLFDLETCAPVPNSIVEITSLIDTAADSAVFNVFSSRVYQVQAEVIGSSGFGVLKTATLI